MLVIEGEGRRSQHASCTYTVTREGRRKTIEERERKQGRSAHSSCMGEGGSCEPVEDGVAVELHRPVHGSQREDSRFGVELTITISPAAMETLDLTEAAVCASYYTSMAEEASPQNHHCHSLNDMLDSKASFQIGGLDCQKYP